MKVITKNRIVVRNGAGNFSQLTGKSSSAEIKHFQNWSNKIKGTKLSVDGKWGSKTASAWKAHGTAYDTAFKASAQTLADTFGPSGSDETIASSKPSQPRTKGKLFDNLKNLWGKAKDSGLVDKGRELASQTKFGQKASGYKDQYGGSGSGAGDMGTELPSVEEKKGMPKALKYTLIGGGILLVLFAGYKMMNSGATAKAK